ncbi:MAG: Nif3-like dinuclear metal center hexameric protein [Promethearchaeota archaeon]
MKAKDIHEFFKKIAPSWLNWNRTVDGFLFGDPEMEITGIAVSWMPTFSTLEKAIKSNCNFFITHEPLYLGIKNQFDVYIGGAVRKIGELGGLQIPLEEDDNWIEKTKWLEEHKIVVYRCHDVWDDFPEIGIHGAWAKWLGFEDKPIKMQKYYEVHEFEPIKFIDLCNKMLQRVKNLGQNVVNFIGNPNKLVSSIILGTGAITSYRIMNSTGADVLLLTDDGTKLWESAQWAYDLEKPIIIVNHATAEEPGMKTLAEYLKKNLPNANSIPIVQIPVGCLYRTIHS